MAYLRDRRAFGNIGTRKFRGARFGDALSPRGPQYTLEGRVLDYSTDVGPFTIVDQSGESNTATLYSGRGLTMDAVNDTVTYATGYSLGSRTATVWMRVDTLGTRVLGSTVGGAFLFTPTARGVWEKLTYTRNNIEGDLVWLAGSDCDIGDLVIGTEHWTHNDWSNPTGDTSNGKTIVDSGPNDYHGTCTGCSGFTGEGIDPEVAGIVGLDDARWFNGTDGYVNLGAGDPLGFDGSGRIDFGCNIVIGGLPTATEDIFYQYVNTTVVGFSVDIQSSGQVRVAGRSVSTDSFQSLLSTTLATVGETRIDAYIDYANDEMGISLNGGAYKTGSVVFGQTSFTYGSSTNNTRIGNSQHAGRFFTGSVFNVEIQEDSVASNSYTGRGTSVTAWEDTIGSNDGTESGTFVSVGQKRATIPQTADKNWNKYQWFNGTDGIVETTGMTAATDYFGACTISSWIFVEDTAATQVIWTLGAANYRLIMLAGNWGISGNNNVGVSVSDGWQHVSVDFNSSGAGVSFSINEVEVWTGDTGTSPPTTNIFSLGARDSAGYGLFFSGLISDFAITGSSVKNFAYTGLGNDPWKDTIGSNDGTEAGTFTRELVSASDANDQIDALGTAISEPRLNTQQLNLFGEGEYSSTPDSDSLDLTTAATWEIWGNFYGVPLTNEAYLWKDDSYRIYKLSADSANAVRFSIKQGGSVIQEARAGITDSTGQLVVTFDNGSAVWYWNGVQIATATMGTAIDASSDPIYMGDKDDGTLPYGGKIGSAKIYNVALTAAEVLTNYNTQKSLYGL